MFDLKNKIALVTGARRGMGRVHALMLAKQGAKVVVTDINEKECSVVVEEIQATGGEAVYFVMDVSKKEEIDRVFNEVVKKFGRLDILINNAGVYDPKPAVEISEKE